MNVKKSSIYLLLAGEAVALLATIVLCVMRFMLPGKKDTQTGEVIQSVHSNEISQNTNWNQGETDLVSDSVENSGLEEAEETVADNSESMESSEETSDTEENSIYPQEAWDKLAMMSLEEKIAQMFVIAPEALTHVSNQTVTGENTRTSYEERPVGGLVYNNKNYNGDERARSMLTGIESISFERTGLGCLLFFRERAGDNRVALAATYDGERLDTLIKSKTFGDLSDLASVLPVYDGVQLQSPDEQGMTDGQTIPDEVKLLMISNQTNTELTGEELPLCFSAVMYETIRNEYGFEGLLMTESLSDDHITRKYSSEEGAVMAVDAGADLIYRPDDFEKAYQGVLSAVADGRISEDRINESVIRIISNKLELDPAYEPVAFEMVTANQNGGNNQPSTNRNRTENDAQTGGQQEPQPTPQQQSTQQQPAQQQQQQQSTQQQQEPTQQSQQQQPEQQPPQPEQQQPQQPQPEQPTPQPEEQQPAEPQPEQPTPQPEEQQPAEPQPEQPTPQPEEQSDPQP